MMYESLTCFIEKLKTDKYGEWYGFDKKKEGVLTLPFVVHSVIVHKFIDAVYAFVDAHEEWNLKSYHKIIEKRCADFQVNNLKEIRVSELDGKTVVAGILSIIRGDRFCEGMLLSACEDGIMIGLLKRLKEIDNNEMCD